VVHSHITQQKMSKPILYIVGCGAGPVKDITKLVSLAADAWKVQVLLTPAGETMVSDEGLPRLQSSREAPPDAIIIAPATFNTVNKLALGICGNRVLDILQPRIRCVPTVVVPFANAGYQNRHPFVKSIKALREEGLTVILPEPHPEGTGGCLNDSFPWQLALEKAATL
jgi:hypothetical protein